MCDPLAFELPKWEAAVAASEVISGSMDHDGTRIHWEVEGQGPFRFWLHWTGVRGLDHESTKVREVREAQSARRMDDPSWTSCYFAPP